MMQRLGFLPVLSFLVQGNSGGIILISEATGRRTLLAWYRRMVGKETNTSPGTTLEGVFVGKGFNTPLVATCRCTWSQGTYVLHPIKTQYTL